MSEQNSEQHEQTPDEVFATAVLFETVLAVVAIMLGWALGPSAREFMPQWNLEKLQPIINGIWQGSLAAVPMLLAIEAIRRIPWGPIRELEQLSDDQMIGALVRLRVPEILMISRIQNLEYVKNQNEVPEKDMTQIMEIIQSLNKIPPSVKEQNEIIKKIGDSVILDNSFNEII